MRNGSYAVLWVLRGRLHTGSVEAFADRLELRTRGRAVAIPLESVSRLAIERGAAARIRGLPVLMLFLSGGDVLRLASLEGVGALHELAGLLSLSVAR